MRLKSIRQFNALLFTLFLALAAPFPAAASSLSVAADPWCPFNCEPGAEQEGYAIDAMRIIFERAGIQIIYKTLPWDRVLAEVKSGRLDAAVGVYRPEAPDLIYPEEDMGGSDNGFFVRKDSDWAFTGIESLHGQRLAFISGYDYGPPFDDYIAAHPNSPDIVVTTGLAPLTRNFQMLAKSRVDVVIVDITAGTYFLTKWEDQAKVRSAGFQGVMDPVFIAFSPAKAQSTRYARILTEGWRALRASGELANILARYGLTDWKQRTP